MVVPLALGKAPVTAGLTFDTSQDTTGLAAWRGCVADILGNAPGAWVVGWAYAYDRIGEAFVQTGAQVSSVAMPVGPGPFFLPMRRWYTAGELKDLRLTGNVAVGGAGTVPVSVVLDTDAPPPLSPRS